MLLRILISIFLLLFISGLTREEEWVLWYSGIGGVGGVGLIIWGGAGMELVLVRLGLDGNRWLEGWDRTRGSFEDFLQ